MIISAVSTHVSLKLLVPLLTAMLNINHTIAICRGDGEVGIEVDDFLAQNSQARLTGMSGAAIDLVVQRKSVVVLKIANKSYSASVSEREHDRDGLFVQFSSHSTFFQHYHSTTHCRTALAHFEASGRFFDSLHESVERTENVTISKLLPSKKHLGVYTKKPPVHLAHSVVNLDTEYQQLALRNMLACHQDVPFLLLGPFGTGKTHILAAAVANLMLCPSNRILVCTHLNRGSDHLSWLLYKYTTRHQSHLLLSCHRILRITPPDKLAKLNIPREISWVPSTHINPSVVSEYSVFVTTFGTALQLKRAGWGGFTHIVIDEGAQSTEPEVLGALCLAERFTKVIIAGDNKQVTMEILL